MAKGAKGGTPQHTHAIVNLMDGTHKPIPKGMEKQFIAQTNAWNNSHGYGDKAIKRRAKKGSNDMVTR